MSSAPGDHPVTPNGPSLGWVVLTRGDRPRELLRGLESLRRQDHRVPIVIVANGFVDDLGVDLDREETVVVSPENLGVPAGRHRGVLELGTDIIAFLDDDAEVVSADTNRRILESFADPAIGATSLRIESETGSVNRRHIPRLGRRGAERSGLVVNFLGGACAIRRVAYDRAGGYWGELFYAHEELDLAWRLHEHGSDVRYCADIVVRHPHTPIGRHPTGWRLTGRNRVMIARRNLPRSVAVIHCLAWLALGTVRAPDRGCRLAYVAGWREGKRVAVDRQPIRWRTVLLLTRRGRPPVL